MKDILIELWNMNASATAIYVVSVTILSLSDSVQQLVYTYSMDLFWLGVDDVFHFFNICSVFVVVIARIYNITSYKQLSVVVIKIICITNIMHTV